MFAIRGKISYIIPQYENNTLVHYEILINIWSSKGKRKEEKSINIWGSSMKIKNKKFHSS